MIQTLLNVLAHWFNPAWVQDQFLSGDGIYLTIWTLFAFLVGFLVGRAWTCVKEGVPFLPMTKGRLVRSMNPTVKGALRDTYNAPGSITNKPYFDDLVSFMRKYPKVFETRWDLEDFAYGDSFQLSPEWRRYLKRHPRCLE